MPHPLASQIQTAVDINPILIGDGFHVEATNEKVTLRGNVSTFYKKQMAQEVAREVAGDVLVENNISVEWN